jgi:hypothetical protein
MDIKRLQELAGIISEEYKIGDYVNIPLLNRRETGIIRRIEDDKALILVRLQNIKDKPHINKEIWINLKDIVKLPK